MHTPSRRTHDTIGFYMIKHIAFLRGVNVVGRRIKMDELRDAFDRMGFPGAQTLIASGNVLFDSKPGTDLSQKIEDGLGDIFGLKIECMVRTLHDVQNISENAPFGQNRSTDDVKLYIYFLATPLAEPLELPFGVADDYQIIGQTTNELYAKAYRMENGRFGPGLDKFAKTIGVINTNRNWNTILRLIDKATS